MGDHQQGPPLRSELLEEVEDVPAGGRVEVAGRLVGEQQRRVAGERTGDRHPLHLPAGELRRTVVHAVREPDLGEEPLDPLLALAPRHALEQELQLHVLPGGDLRQQVEALEDETDPPVADLREAVPAEALDLLAEQPVAPRGRRVETADQVEQRRLARTGRADDRHELARRHREVDPAERFHPHRAGVVDLADAPHRDHRGVDRHRRPAVPAVAEDHCPPHSQRSATAGWIAAARREGK